MIGVAHRSTLEMTAMKTLCQTLSMMVALCGLGLGASDRSAPGGPSGRVAIDVAPLQLAGIANACYGLVVTNEAGEVVWRQSGLCADRFGNGVGALSYVGTCDAGTTEPGDVNENTVTLVLEALYDADGTDPSHLVPEATYTNPCGLPAAHPLNASGVAVNDDGYGPCVVKRACRANEDVAVRFDLTIMRRAQQGFFDIAVNFEDTFCSAKVDCVDSPGLLHYPTGWTTASGAAVGGTRGPTVVVGFACTSGTSPDGVTPEPTWLYLSDLVITCTPSDLGPFTLHVADLANGNQGAAGGAIFQWAQYADDEEVSPALDKCFWNYAIGVDLTRLAGHRCTLTATGTASDTPFGAGLHPPADGVWPVIQYDVVLTDGQGGFCDNQGLDQPASGVTTSYYVPGPTTPAPTFADGRLCGSSHEVSCTDTNGVTFVATTVTHEGQQVPGLEVAVGGLTAAFPLPPTAPGDAWNVAGCCLDACCAPN